MRVMKLVMKLSVTIRNLTIKPNEIYYNIQMLYIKFKSI
jgi:hypothetical protein